MEASREKCGNRHKSILATGVIIAKKASVFSSTRMEINTKECGPLTKDTVRERTGSLKATN